jgi:hypothetical protein
MLLTPRQVAARLGVSVERVLLWTREGLLPIAGQDEEGRPLFREHLVATRGAELAGRAPPNSGPEITDWAGPRRPGQGPS